MRNLSLHTHTHTTHKARSKKLFTNAPPKLYFNMETFETLKQSQRTFTSPPPRDVIDGGGGSALHCGWGRAIQVRKFCDHCARIICPQLAPWLRPISAGAPACPAMRAMTRREALVPIRHVSTYAAPIH